LHSFRTQIQHVLRDIEFEIGDPFEEKISDPDPPGVESANKEKAQCSE